MQKIRGRGLATVLLGVAALPAAPGAGAAGERTPVRAGAPAVILSVPGIPGPYCAYGIEKRLLSGPGVVGATADWKAEEIRVFLAEGAQLPDAAIREAVRQADYPYDYEIHR